MYVEFVGTSGAGKTALAENLRKTFESNNIPCITRATFFSSKKSKTYLFFWTMFMVRYLGVSSAKLMLLLYFKKRLGMRRTMRAMHEHLKLSYLLSNYRQQSIILWDGGFIQRFANLVVMKLRSSSDISNFTKEQLPLDTLLVFVDTPIGSAISRRHHREVQLRTAAGRRIPQRDINQLEEEREFLNQTKQAQIEVVEQLNEGGVRVLKVDGLLPPEKNASIVYEYIKTML